MQELLSQLRLILRPPRQDEPELEFLEQRLARLHTLMLRAHDNVGELFKRIEESALAEAGLARAEALGDLEAPPTWLDRLDPSPKGVAEALATEIRGVDHALHVTRYKEIGFADPDTHWKTRDKTAYVIPNHGVAPRGKPMTDQSYTRRGLLWHRVMPTNVNGFEVRLYRGDVGERSGRDRRHLAGALFNDFGLTLSRPDATKTFFVQGVNCPELSSQLVTQLDALQAAEPGLLAAVWPELTGPPQVRDQIVQRLARWPYRGNHRRPSVVLPGSWHEPTPKGRVNVIRVLNGFGREIVPPCEKTRAFNLDGRFEDIQPGTGLPVLVIGELLVGMAICKDFCDRSRDLPYLHLPLDLVLVPSFGDDLTMRSHCVAASDLWIRHHTRSFVVQQESRRNLDWGYVLPAPERPGEATLDSLRRSQLFSIFSFDRES